LLPTLARQWGRVTGVNLKQADVLINQLSVLVVDHNAFMRKPVRSTLTHLGVKTIYEAADGIAAMETIRSMMSDVVILDWEMPVLTGPELVRIVRLPGVLSMPDIPIIRLTAHGERLHII